MYSGDSEMEFSQVGVLPVGKASVILVCKTIEMS